MQISKGLKKLCAKISVKINNIKYFKSLGVKIGNNTVIYSSDYAMFSTEPWLVKIGDNCSITEGVKFLTHDGGTLVTRNMDNTIKDFVICGNIQVGNNTYIGIKTVILPGVVIGSNCIIGCGSIVTKNIPDNSVACGVPCRVISNTENYIQKVHDILDGKNIRYYSSLEYMHSLNPNKK